MAHELTPADRSRLARWLEGRSLDWPPGRSFAVEDGSSIATVAHLREPSPGDGYHREHVRELALAGDPGGMIEAACAAAQAWDGRIEATAASCDERAREAFAAAGLAREVALRGSWRVGDACLDFELWGRVAAAGTAPDEARARPHAPAPDGSFTLAWHDAATKGSLRAFASALVPGRSYPPGTLLSEAEQVETTIGSALHSEWILAIAQDERVVGGLVFARNARPEHDHARDHVRRVHLDVLPGWQGRGIATSMLRLARREAHARLGASILEADPRAGNIGACRALELAGFELAGTQRGAWRMRRGGERWDEDVRFHRADCGG